MKNRVGFRAKVYWLRVTVTHWGTDVPRWGFSGGGSFRGRGKCRVVVVISRKSVVLHAAFVTEL